MATPTSLPATFVSGNVLTAAQMNDLRGAFRILQVVSTSKTDTFSTSSTSFTDVTGLSVTITPSAATSKVFLMLTVGQGGGSTSLGFDVQIERDGTPIGVGDTAGNRTPVGISILSAAANAPQSMSWSFLDSPASTSALAYQAQVRTNTGTLYINRYSTDNDNAGYTRAISTLTAVEVSA